MKINNCKASTGDLADNTFTLFLSNGCIRPGAHPYSCSFSPLPPES